MLYLNADLRSDPPIPLSPPGAFIPEIKELIVSSLQLSHQARCPTHTELFHKAHVSQGEASRRPGPTQTAGLMNNACGSCS